MSDTDGAGMCKSALTVKKKCGFYSDLIVNKFEQLWGREKNTQLALYSHLGIVVRIIAFLCC